MTTVTKQIPAAEGRTGWPREGVTGALGGLAFVVLILVGNTLYEEGGQRALGTALEMLGFAAFACFLAYLASVLPPRGWARWLAVTGGVLMLAVKVGTVAAAVAADNVTLSGDVDEGLRAVGDAGFVLSWLPHGLFVLGVSVAALAAHTLPRPLAWAGAVIGAGLILAGALPSAEFVLPFLLSLLWTIAVSVVLARREARGADWTVEV